MSYPIILAGRRDLEEALSLARQYITERHYGQPVFDPPFFDRKGRGTR